MTPSFAAPWGARDYTTRLPGGPVHWIEFGTSSAGPPLVFVHGLGGSHLNWVQVGPDLAATRRAVALDLRGFGLSPGTSRTATVAANTALLDQFLREVTGTPAVLAGNSMGGMISILQACHHPETVAGLVLIAPALPPPRQRPDWLIAREFVLFALPGLGELYLRAARRPPEVVVRRVLALCFADPGRADPAMVAASVALARYRRSMPGCDESLLAASRSLMRILARRQRYSAMMAAVTAPVLLIAGEADRLVPVASVRRAAALNPSWDCQIMPAVGHTPQLEVPHAVTEAVADWLSCSSSLASTPPSSH